MENNKIGGEKTMGKIFRYLKERPMHMALQRTLMRKYLYKRLSDSVEVKDLLDHMDSKLTYAENMELMKERLKIAKSRTQVRIEMRQEEEDEMLKICFENGVVTCREACRETGDPAACAKFKDLQKGIVVPPKKKIIKKVKKVVKKRVKVEKKKVKVTKPKKKILKPAIKKIVKRIAKVKPKKKKEVKKVAKKKYLKKVRPGRDGGHSKVYPSRQKSPVVHKSITGRKYIMVSAGAGKGLKRKYLTKRK